MNITVERKWILPTCTIGEMSIDGVRECYTLEDVVRPEGEKVYGQTAIPSGTYQVVVTHSNRFKRDLPLLVNVTNFEGVRIHPGNTAENTEGCILVGKTRGEKSIGQSRDAFNALFDKIQAARGTQDITITIG